MLNVRKGKRRKPGEIDLDLVTELTPPSSPERRLLMQYAASLDARRAFSAAADAESTRGNLLRAELEEAGVRLPEDVV